MTVIEAGIPYRYVRSLVNSVETAIDSAAQSAPKADPYAPRSIDRATMQKATSPASATLAMQLFDAVAKNGVATDRDLYTRAERSAASLITADRNANGIISKDELRSAGIVDPFANAVYAAANLLGG